MTTDNIKVLLPLFNLLPPSLRGQAYITGGAVLDPRLASDIDIVVLSDGDGMRSPNSIQQELAAYLFENDIHTDFIKEQYDSITEFRVMTTIDVGRPVQLILRIETDIHDVLSKYDLSISMWAIGYDGQIYNTERSTRLLEEIIAVNPKNPTSGNWKLKNTTNGRIELMQRRQTVNKLLFKRA